MQRKFNSKIIQNFLGEIEGVDFDIELIFKITSSIRALIQRLLPEVEINKKILKKKKLILKN